MRFANWSMTTWLLLAELSPLPLVSAADDVRVRAVASIGTDEAWRGISLNDGRPTPQLSIFLDARDRWSGSATLTQSRRKGLFNAGRDEQDLEARFALNYRVFASETWSAGIGLADTEIIRPANAADWDWYEVHAALEHVAGYTLRLSYSPSLFSLWQATTLSAGRSISLPYGMIADTELGVSQLGSRGTTTIPFVRAAFAVPVTRRAAIVMEYQYSGDTARERFASDRTGHTLLLRGVVHFAD
jgi:hypothetical protein